MQISYDTLKKYVKRAKLEDAISSKLIRNTYYLKCIGWDMPYDRLYDTTYQVSVENRLLYDDNLLYFASGGTESFREDGGFFPENYKQGQLIYSENLTLDDINDEYIQNRLGDLIIEEFRLNEELIEKYTNSPEENATVTYTDDMYNNMVSSKFK